MRKSVPFSLLSSSSFHFEKEEKFPFVSHQWPNSRRNEDDDDQVSSSSYLLLVARALFRRRPALDVEKKKWKKQHVRSLATTVLMLVVDAVRIFRFVCCRSSIRKFLLRDPPKELGEGGGRRKLKFLLF
jgi:hypothetical protein